MLKSARSDTFSSKEKWRYPKLFLNKAQGSKEHTFQGNKSLFKYYTKCKLNIIFDLCKKKGYFSVPKNYQISYFLLSKIFVIKTATKAYSAVILALSAYCWY